MEKKGFIHRDLAARNILISGDGSNVKVRKTRNKIRMNKNIALSSVKL